ncbi:HET-domain-containing protein [Ophiobolus disseminans]|uniref:HET-domain-containing protein n=1 Tax=Ophiobolus disseminans TaxID=1469910 RepID=A0A6A6ZVP8_9PLEO|nr:HET-domain-containing protein [Ophiobolus disseminans]
MHLLQQDDDGAFSLVLFYKNPPPYAILSHRWIDDEPTFQDVKHGLGREKAGYDKLLFCGRQAAKNDLKYFWVDTVCIDKTSSAELTEALNSMFRWYRDAKRCYVYMNDVVSAEPDFQNSAWFTRGWTLQELVAPKVVEFYSKDGVFLGTKVTMEEQISSSTGIPIEALRGKSLNSFSIEERMSWTQKRQTTREEDMSYCLLGIFDVYMPVIYGEGERAFGRLLREVEEVSKGQRSGFSKSPVC